jgi:Na+-translocating membrane potential-generating system (MpsC)
MVVVVLRDSLTKAERVLVRAAKDAEVLHLRRTFQETMSLDLLGVVERLTACNVQAFMSANHIAPDTAAGVFLMDRDVGAGDARKADQRISELRCLRGRASRSGGRVRRGSMWVTRRQAPNAQPARVFSDSQPATDTGSTG